MKGYDEWLQSGDPGTERDDPCPDCGGTGAVPSIGEPNADNGLVPCPTCRHARRPGVRKVWVET